MAPLLQSTVYFCRGSHCRQPCFRSKFKRSCTVGLHNRVLIGFLITARNSLYRVSQNLVYLLDQLPEEINFITWSPPVFDMGLLTLFFKQVMISVGSIVKTLSILTLTTHPQLCRQQVANLLFAIVVKKVSV